MKNSARKNAKHNLSLTSALSRMRTDERGNAIILVGFAMGIVVMSAGAAIDVGRRSLGKEELASAVDTAALAACRAWKLTNNATQLENVKTAQRAEAQKYVSANFNHERFNATEPLVEVTFPAVTNSNTPGSFQDMIKVKVTASATVPTTLLQVAGTDSLGISAVSECSRAQGGIELTMVLDTTGSMSGNINGKSKIQSLRDATGKMLDLLYGSADTSNLVRINVIPYSVSVNVGRLLNANDLETNPDDPSYNFAALQSFDPLNATNTSVSNSKWYGCILERETRNDIGLTASGDAAVLNKNLDHPTDAFDVRDIPVNTVDTITGKNSGRWKPFIQKYNTGQNRPQHTQYKKVGSSYTREQNSGTYGGNGNRNRGGCSAPAVHYSQGLTKTNLKTLLADSDYMIPDGNTYSDVGMAWGVRMMSPQEPFSSPINYSDRYSTDTSNPYSGWVKGILMMTDGIIVASDPLQLNTGDPSDRSLMTAYGFTQAGNSIKDYNQAMPTSGSASTIEDLNNNISYKLRTAHEQRLLMSCKQARKPAGWDVPSNPNRENDAIRVYTIFFGSATELTSKAQIYKDCAGADGFFVNAQDDTQLNSAFSQIASDLQNLRLSL